MPISEIIEKLVAIDGIGPAKARELIRAGVRGPKDLSRPEIKKTLSKTTLLALKYPKKGITWAMADEFIRALPRNFIGVGSYRRRAPIMGDLDLLILQPIGVARALFEKHSPGIILEVVHGGATSAAYYVKYKGHTFRAEIYSALPENLIPARLHWTGNFNFNIRIRAQAKRLGYTLSQYGLYKGKKKVPIHSEKELFKILGITYIPAHDRSE